MRILFYFSFLFILLSTSACTTEYFTALRKGAQIPDMTLPNAAGEMITLSTIDDKIVLVYFWASWCKPCRESHFKLKEIYEAYKDQPLDYAKGFEIYAISVDTDREKWLKAVEKDDLPWIQVCDLQGMKTPLIEETFQVEQIPTSYLLNLDGIVIGKDMFYDQMEWELKYRTPELQEKSRWY